MATDDIRDIEPLFQPPAPAGDLRGMLRRRIAATALGQLAAREAARAKLKTPAEWRRYGAGVRANFVTSLRSVGFPAVRGPVRVRRVSERTFRGFSVENVLFESLPGWWVNATVWKPDPRRWAPPWRAVIMPVGHNGKYNPSEQFPPQVFAANGFLTVSFDPPGFGEKTAGNDHFTDGVRCYLGGHNPMAFFLADAVRAVDYSVGRPDVDARGGVAMTGVSGGGMTSICGAIVDPRVRIVGASCFGLPESLHPIRNGYAACPETQSFGGYRDGINLADLLLAARFCPMLLMMGRRDAVMTPAHFRALDASARRAYAGAGLVDRLRVFIDDCGHEYTVAQAVEFVRWMRAGAAAMGDGRWAMGKEAGARVEVPEVRLLPQESLECRPPRGLTMAEFVAAEARARRPETNAARGRKNLAKLVWPKGTAKERPVRAVRGGTARLWTHSLAEISLRGGRDWELPATVVRRLAPVKPEQVLVYFDDRGRWTSLHQWGWLTRAVGFFSARAVPLALLTVDLPGWGDTRPTPSPWDVVGWGGVDRWLAYVSAATGDSVMALRVREALRCVAWARREFGVGRKQIILGGHGLGANVAAFASFLLGGVGGLVLVEPLAEFAGLATEPKVAWPQDVFFPGILGAVDLPEVLRLGRTPAIVAGARDAAGRLLGRSQCGRLRTPRGTILAEGLSSAAEIALVGWLHRHVHAPR